MSSFVMNSYLWCGFVYVDIILRCESEHDWIFLFVTWF